MTKIIKFLDNNKKGRWANFRMDNNDPCWLSVSQSGVLIKKSKIGLFGAKLYEEKNIAQVAEKALALNEKYPTDLTPNDIVNPVMKSFVNAILHCGNIGAVATNLHQNNIEISTQPNSNINYQTQVTNSGCIKCSDTTFEYDNYYNEYTCVKCGWVTKEKPNGTLSILNDNDVPNKLNPVSLDKEFKIINEYGLIIANTPPSPLSVIDENKLPYSKDEIKSAIIFCLNNTNDPEMIASLQHGYLQLSSWQQGVGENNIGIDLSSNPDISPNEYLKMHPLSKDWLEIANKEYKLLQKDLEELNR